jgi:hypothetical protein
MAWTPLGWMDMGEDPDDLHEVVAPGATDAPDPWVGVPVRQGQGGPIVGEVDGAERLTDGSLHVSIRVDAAVAEQLGLTGIVRSFSFVAPEEPRAD